MMSDKTKRHLQELFIAALREEKEAQEKDQHQKEAHARLKELTNRKD